MNIEIFPLTDDVAEHLRAQLGLKAGFVVGQGGASSARSDVGIAIGAITSNDRFPHHPGLASIS